MEWRGWILGGLLAMSAFTVTAQVRPKRWHLSLSPGLDFATLRGRDSNGTSVFFPNGNNFRIGAAFEFNTRSPKWVPLFEPAYQRYTAAAPYPVEYSSIETAVGLRRNFFLNAYNGFFIQGMGIGDIPLNFEMELAPNTVFPSNSFRANVAVGAGAILGRFSLEYRQHSKRTIRDDYGSFTFNYTKRSIIASFRIF